MADRIQHRYDTKANWEKFNPVLMKGEVGYEDDGEQYKIGDGRRAWNQLPYRGLPCLDQMGNDKLTPMSQDAITKEIKKLVQKRMILNISQEVENYKFAGKATARLAVPKEHRGIAQILIYQTIERIVIEYCIATDINDDNVWKADSSWKAVGSGGALNISEEKNNYAFASKAEARNAVQSSDRKEGQLISYKLAETGWVYEMFVSDDLSKWANDDSWNYSATDKHLQALTDFLTQSITDFDTRLTETLQQITDDVNNTITEVKDTVDTKIRELETYLSGELSKFNQALSNLETNLKKAIAAKADGCRLTDDNKLQLVSEGKDLGDPLELPTGILNLSYKDNKEFADSASARKTVKTNDRILGQVITYKLSDGTWVLDQFIGESVGSWESEGSWVNYALVRDLSPLLLDLETIRGQVAGLSADVKSKVDGGYTEDMDENTIELVLTSNGEEVSRIQLPKGGGSGGPVGVIMRLKAIGSTSLVVGEGADAIVKYNWTSVDQETGEDTGNGTVFITVNGIPVYSGEVPQGDNQYNIKDSLNLGTNNVRVRVTDGFNNARSISFSVQKASLILTSTFADDVIYRTTPVAFRYTLIGSGEKKVRFWLNGTELESETTTASGKQLTKNLTNLISGANSIKVVAESNIEGAQMVSNELYYEFIFANAGVKEPVITISYQKKTASQFEIIDIPYLVYDPNNLNADVELVINDVVKQRLKVPRSRQYWSYAAYEQGVFNMEIRCKGISKSVRVEVIPSRYDIAEEKGDLRYKASAIGKSNNGEDKASWDYGDFSAVFKNFLWGEDGWHKDENGDNHLRLIGDASVDMNIRPFSNSVVQNGMTLTVEYATQNVTDTEAEVISCMLDGVGILITPSFVHISSAQTNLSVHLDSSTKTSITFVVEKSVENRLIYLFVDGIMSGTVRYPASDNFSQSTPQGLKLTSGERSCTAMIYGIRWYENNLNFDQVFNNYIFDIEDFDDKIAKYDFNNVIDDYGSVSYDKALEFLPCLTIIGDLPTYKGDKKTCDIVYEDRKNPLNSFTAQNIENDVQGTSSQYYPRKNFKFVFSEGVTMSETGQHLDKYQMEGKRIPSDVFCMKADFAESSGTHNTGMAVIIDEALRKLGYKVPPQENNDLVRTTVYGYPILIFHKKTISDNSEFVGKYNFNDEKSAHDVFGFTAGHECWEFNNNTSDNCLFKTADFTSTTTDDKGNVVPVWTLDFDPRYPSKNKNPENLEKLCRWVVSCKDNPTKFKNECAEHFNVNWLLFYCLVTEVYGMVDQRAKNQMMTTYGELGTTGELIWYFIFYDNDTVLGINNEGLISFGYDIETRDPFQDGHVWNGWNSVLWNLVETAYKNELQDLYQKIRQQNVLSSSTTLEVLQNRQSDKWCEAVYNRDGYFKYIEPLTNPEPGEEPNGSYLPDLQGSRTRHRLWWVKNRFSYMDSKYNAGDYMNNFATMRLYTPREWGGVAPNADFNISINRPGYFHIKYGSYLTNSIRGEAGKTYKISAPSSQFNDTETIIYGISSIKSLGDLSPKYPGTVDITKAVALEELLIGSLSTGYKNQNLTVLHTGSNEMLRVVNVANCPNLKQSLELDKCYSLEEVEARGSGITGLELPSSGILKVLNLPDSLTSLYLKNQPYLTTLTMESYKNLNTIVIDNVPNVDGYSIVKQCVETDNSKLGKVRLTNIDVVDSSSRTLMKLLDISGEDDNGNPTDVAFVTGKIHVGNISMSVYNRIIEEMPHLTVTYNVILDVIEFEDSRVKAIAVANYDTNKDGEVSADEVRYSTITPKLFTGSGAVKFNEARYWGGAGSIINDCDTLEEVTLVAGKVELNNLPKLKKLGVLSTGETPYENPKFGYSTVQNCYSIEQFVLSGRYFETAQKGAIMAKQIINNQECNKIVLPLKGYQSITIDEECKMLSSDINEDLFSWSTALKTLTFNRLYDVSLPRFPNLETLIINGSTGQFNRLILPAGATILQNLIINDTSGNNIDVIEIQSPPRNMEFNNLKCLGTTGSYFRLSYGTPIVQRLDFPATYQPAAIGLHRGSGSTPFVNGAKIILRSPSFIALTELQNENNLITNPVSGVYVPDGLVGVYKTATNWNRFGDKILPLSIIGE